MITTWTGNANETISYVRTRDLDELWISDADIGHSKYNKNRMNSTEANAKYPTSTSDDCIRSTSIGFFRNWREFSKPRVYGG